MKKIRVLIVDDAVVIRKLLSDVLSSDPLLEVVGTAANGRIALSKIPQVNPDVVILDVEMPEMDGLETLREIRKTYPRLPVIMFSTLTQRGAAATLDALALGANDYVPKPANVGSVTLGMQRMREELIPRIKLFGGAPEVAPLRPSVVPRHPPLSPAVPLRSPRRVDVVAVGVSTGGPNALAAILPSLPARFPVPILIVQHMPPMFTRLLAERLSSTSAIPVKEGAPGEKVQPPGAWIAPGDFHMVVVRDGTAVRIQTHQGPPENSCRPAVDVLFRSAAEVYGAHALAVILTGMGQDGLRGCEAIRAAGGQVIAQDEASSVVWGMPGAVVAAGLADEILPLESMASALIGRVQHGYQQQRF